MQLQIGDSPLFCHSLVWPTVATGVQLPRNESVPISCIAINAVNSVMHSYNWSCLHIKSIVWSMSSCLKKTSATNELYSFLVLIYLIGIAIQQLPFVKIEISKSLVLSTSHPTPPSALLNKSHENEAKQIFEVTCIKVNVNVGQQLNILMINNGLNSHSSQFSQWNV